MNVFRNSRAYRKAKSMVDATIESPATLLGLISAAQTKLTAKASSKMAQVLEPLSASFRLVHAYATGSYRQISLENLGLIVAAITYFVMPVDALPDFILALGLTDDAAILAWTFKKIGDELQRFTQWERENINDS